VRRPQPLTHSPFPVCFILFVRRYGSALNMKAFSLMDPQQAASLFKVRPPSVHPPPPSFPLVAIHTISFVFLKLALCRCAMCLVLSVCRRVQESTALFQKALSLDPQSEK
jgi:hypothetical protein